MKTCLSNSKQDERLTERWLLYLKQTQTTSGRLGEMEIVEYAGVLAKVWSSGVMPVVMRGGGGSSVVPRQAYTEGKHPKIVLANLPHVSEVLAALVEIPNSPMRHFETYPGSS